MSYRFAGTSEPSPTENDFLAAINYGQRHIRSPDPRHLTVGLPHLHPDDPLETWRISRVMASGWDGEMGYVEGTDLSFVHRLIEETDRADLSRTTFELYSDLLGRLQRRGFPYLLRVWNLIESIHDMPDGMERYRAFGTGRARAFDQAGLETGAIPAASAIGTSAPGLLVYALASRVPGTAIENPRQTPAYRYPRRYGPHPPYFARATRAPKRCADALFLSGTASVVGHRSLHPGDPGKQLDETLHNLESLMQAAGAAPPQRPRLLKVYLRPPHETRWIESRLRDWAGPDTRILLLRGEICRHDLEIEIEGLV